MMDGEKIIIVPKARPAVDFASNLLVIPKDDFYGGMKMEKEELKILITIIILIVVLFGLIYYAITREEYGALYIDNVYVCDGVLKTHGENTLNFGFYCADGRVIENVNNFTLKRKDK